jgi:hypothetical protein
LGLGLGFALVAIVNSPSLAVLFASPLKPLLRCIGFRVRGDFAGLFEGGFEIFDDLLRENVGIGEIVGFLEAFGADPKVI